MTPRIGLNCLGLVFAVGLGACSPEEESAADEYVESCQVQMETFASPESFRAILKAEEAQALQVDDAKVPTVALNPGGRVISANIPPTFLLEVPGATTSEAHLNGGTGRPGRVWGRFFREIRAALAWQGTAHAASCPPFTGENYLLRLTNVRTPTRHAYTALLSVKKLIPEASIWKKAMDGRIGQNLRLSVMRATFRAGALVEGPIVASSANEFLVLP
jgi:hypothetical protein